MESDRSRTGDSVQLAPIKHAYVRPLEELRRAIAHPTWLSDNYSFASPPCGRPPVPLFRTKRFCARVSFQPHSGQTPDRLPMSEYSHRLHTSNFLRRRLASPDSRNLVPHSQHFRVSLHKLPNPSPSVITRTSKPRAKLKDMRTRLAKLSTSFVSVVAQFGHSYGDDIGAPRSVTGGSRPIP